MIGIDYNKDHRNLEIFQNATLIPKYIFVLDTVLYELELQKYFTSS